MSPATRLRNGLTPGLWALVAACGLAGCALTPAVSPVQSSPLPPAVRDRLLDPGLPLAPDSLVQHQRENLYLQSEAARGGNGSQDSRPNQTVALPAERAELASYSFKGGDQAKSTGTGLVLRKTLAERYSLGLAYGNQKQQAAALDLAAGQAVAQQNRNTLALNADALVRDALLSVSVLSHRSPDEQGRGLALDMAHDLMGGVTSVNLGFSRGSSDLLKTGDPLFRERSTQWRYRMGMTQVLGARWLASAQYEAVQDAGYLGNPYGTATVFGAIVPERTPSTRGSRAVKLRTAAQLGAASARFQLRGEYRYFWDNWGIKAHTSEWGLGRQFGAAWRVDAALRFHTQSAALFYSDNATLETIYLNRDRQYGSLRNTGFIISGGYTVGGGASARWQALLGASVETRQMRHTDFTDLRTGRPYANNTTLLQLNATLRF